MNLGVSGRTDTMTEHYSHVDRAEKLRAAD